MSAGNGSDGRFIDEQLGILSGEGAQQRSRGDSQQQTSLERHVYEQPAADSAELADPTYYGHSAIKKSVWSWAIPLYYYVGGTAGGIVVLGAAATMAGRDRFPLLSVRSRWVGAIAGGLSAALLIYDLGRPTRFLYMLRVFRPTSPMNVGSWVLTGFSSLSGLAALASRGAFLVRFVGDTAHAAAGVLGLVLSGYTGVLVANTVVPIWQRPHRTLPLLFLASGASGGASLLTMFEWNPAEERAISTFGAIGKLADFGIGHMLQRQIATVPEAVTPLREGFSGFLWKSGKALTAASFLLALIPGSSRRRDRLAGVLGTAGALCLRFGIHYAGQASAENPRATFHQQRAGQGAMAITGIPAVTGPNGERALQ